MEVRLLDKLGDDLTVVNAARVSFDNMSGWADPVLKTLSERDKRLIQYLARGVTKGDWDDLVDTFLAFPDRDYIKETLHRVKSIPTHWAPFAHPKISFRIKVPFFVARQLDKHVQGIDTSEISRRYVTTDPEIYMPEDYRLANPDLKQGSSEEIYSDDYFLDIFEGHMDKSVELYKKAIENGICPEQARIILPMATYTEYVKTGSLYAWARVYNQRTGPGAQKEIGEVAEQIGQIIEALFPVSWSALTKEN